MLRFKSIRLTNFGPFKGTQEMHFKDTNGVTSIYGATSRGKTFLLNAFRFLFFDQIISRHGKVVAKKNVTNSDAMSEGVFGFEVEIECVFEGKSYIITRVCKPRPDIEMPKTDNDFLPSDLFVQINGEFLSKQDKDDLLARMIPKEVARFFLFDAELLEQYEQLVEESSADGRQIAEAIEAILGVPVLLNCHADLQDLERTVSRQEQRMLKKTEKTKKQAEQMEQYETELIAMLKEREDLDESIKRLEGEKVDYSNSLKENTEYEVYLERLDNENRKLKETKELKQKALDKLKEESPKFWKAILKKGVLERLADTRASLDKERLDFDALYFKQAEQKIRDSSRKKGKCSICGTVLDATWESRISNDDGILNDDILSRKNRISELEAREEILLGFNVEIEPTTILRIQEDFDEARIKEHIICDKINEINRKIEGVDVEDLRSARKKYTNCVTELAEKLQARRKTEEVIGDLKKTIRQIQSNIDASEVTGLDRSTIKRQFVSELSELISLCVAEFRQTLRKKVEEDANEVFRMLSPEEDHGGLKINEQFGLTLIHKNGKEIAIRSSGVEQTVALALIGALHRNAPLRGPIIMDSTLSRISTDYRSKLIETLPHISDQVILFVLDGDIEPSEIRRLLYSKLTSEYQLERLSGTQTQLTPLREV